MRGDVQEEMTTMACVHELGLRRSPQREPTKHKWPGVEGKRLLTILPLFANKLDAIKLFESTFRDGKNGCGPLETVSYGQKTVALFVRGLRAGCIMGCIVVPE
jgi:hypothetical protein